MAPEGRKHSLYIATKQTKKKTHYTIGKAGKNIRKNEMERGRRHTGRGKGGSETNFTEKTPSTKTGRNVWRVDVIYVMHECMHDCQDDTMCVLKDVQTRE